MAETYWITKGTRLRAQWFEANDPPSSLAGMQMKLGVAGKNIVGVVQSVRGDAPTVEECTEIVYHVQPDGGGEVVVVKQQWVVEVFDAPTESCP